MKPADIEIGLDEVNPPEARGFKTPRGMHRWILIIVVGMMGGVLLIEGIRGDNEQEKKNEAERNEGTSKRANNIETPAPLEVLKGEVDEQISKASAAQKKPVGDDLPPMPPGVAYPTGAPMQGSAANVVDQMKRTEQVLGSPLMAIAETTMPMQMQSPQVAALEELKQRQAQIEQTARDKMNQEIESMNRTLQGANQGEQLTLTRAEENMRWLERQTSQANPPIRAIAATSQNTLVRGTTIPSVTLMEIASDLPGNFTAMVSEDVYDSITANTVLIPKGSKLFGVFNSNIKMGQSKVMIAFTWLYLPSGAAIPLNGMQGADAMGMTGITGEIDNQFMKIFGAAFAIGLIDRVANGRSSGVSIAGPGTATSQGGMTQILVNTANQILERNRAIQPRVVVAAATKFNVVISQDIQIDPRLVNPPTRK